MLLAWLGSGVDDLDGNVFLVSSKDADKKEGHTGNQQLRRVF
jgi:hypothetical protein